jgi:hypothetical protein
MAHDADDHLQHRVGHHRLDQVALGHEPGARLDVAADGGHRGADRVGVAQADPDRADLGLVRDRRPDRLDDDREADRGRGGRGVLGPAPPALGDPQAGGGEPLLARPLVEQARRRRGREVDRAGRRELQRRRCGEQSFTRVGVAGAIALRPSVSPCNGATPFARSDSRASAGSSSGRMLTTYAGTPVVRLAWTSARVTARSASGSPYSTGV